MRALFVLKKGWERTLATKMAKATKDPTVPWKCFDTISSCRVTCVPHLPHTQNFESDK
jgi:hypothetical protein